MTTAAFAEGWLREGPGSLTLWVPGRVPGLNDLLRMKGARYKGSYNKVKKQWAARVATAARQGDLFAGERPFGRVTVHLHVVEKDMRRDPDGFCSSSAKLVLDGLVHAKVLAGDGWKHVAAISFSWSVDASDPGVRVVITEAT